MFKEINLRNHSSLHKLFYSLKGEENTAKHRVNIVTSTNIYADIAKNIVGKHGHVQAIIKNDA